LSDAVVVVRADGFSRWELVFSSRNPVLGLVLCFPSYLSTLLLPAFPIPSKGFLLCILGAFPTDLDLFLPSYIARSLQVITDRLHQAQLRSLAALYHSTVLPQFNPTPPPLVKENKRPGELEIEQAQFAPLTTSKPKRLLS
jgi:hypothetical protein